MLLEQREHVGAVPARLAKFDRVPAPGGQQLEERCKPLEVDRPSGWKLVKHRPKRSTKVRGAREKPLERLGRVLQLLHMSEKTARLHREQEPWRCIPSPCGKRRRFWQAI